MEIYIVKINYPGTGDERSIKGVQIGTRLYSVKSQRGDDGDKYPTSSPTAYYTISEFIHKYQNHGIDIYAWFPGGQQIPVEIVNDQPKYLRTIADGNEENNLVKLPRMEGLELCLVEEIFHH